MTPQWSDNLKQLVTHEIQALLDESFRGFSMKQFKKLDTEIKRKSYATRHLPRLGGGSAREVFGLGSGKILKIAQGSSGPRQNKAEVEAYTRKGMENYLAKIYDFDSEDYRWLISEGVKVIGDNADLNKKMDMPWPMLNIVVSNANKSSFKEALETSIQVHNDMYKTSLTHENLNPLAMQLLESAYELSNMGIYDIETMAHWGITTSGQIVVVDYGISLAAAEDHLREVANNMISEILIEASYTEADIPKFFWMVTSVDEYSKDSMEQLATGELKGVKGISDTKEIVVQWLGVARNAVLVIPAKEFLELNNVSRVMYENPHYLVSKGMAALFRLFNRSPKNDYDWSGLMQTLVDYVKKAGMGSSTNNKNMDQVLYGIDYGTLSSSWFASKFAKQRPSINTVKDLSRWIRNVAVEIAMERGEHFAKYTEALSDADWMPLVVGALEAIGNVYKNEGEWLVKDEAMTVPKNSTLFVALDIDPKKISNQAREQFAKDPDPDSHKYGWPTPQLKQEKQALKLMELALSYGLDKHYRLKFISMKKFDEYKKKFWAKQAAEERQ